MKKRFFTLLLASALIVSVTACTTTIAESNTQTSTNESSTTVPSNSVNSNIVESGSKNEETTSATSSKAPETTTASTRIPQTAIADTESTPSIQVNNYPDYIKSDFDKIIWNGIYEGLIENNMLEGSNHSEKEILVTFIALFRGYDPTFPTLPTYEEYGGEYCWPIIKKTYIKSVVTSSCSTAATIRNHIDYFLTDADIRGFCMKMERDRLDTLDIIVKTENGVTTWYVSAVNPDNFKSNDKIKWGVEGYADSDTIEEDITNGESYLAYYLMNEFPYIKNASIKVALNRQMCKSVAYCENRTSKLKYGTDCPEINEVGEFQTTFNWSGYDGVNSNYEFVGTAPFVPMG